MMERNEEVESIEQSTNAIAMLHKNLDIYLKETKFEREKFLLNDIVDKQVKFFRPLYDHLKWEIEVDNRVVESNQNALNRIIYNLLSNACKYNTSHGYIQLKTRENQLIITNDSYGIKNPSKVFDRFYKEGNRGLGIGLHIVSKLSKELDIRIKLEVKNKIQSLKLYNLKYEEKY